MAPVTILVVEDNELNLKLVKGLLTLGKFDTLTAPDAETGIELARRHKPDLILMDIQLPGLDGLSATRVIKSDAQLEHIPVVALTSYAMHGDDQKAKAAGCNGYVTKPIDTRNFTKIIESFLEPKSHLYPKFRPDSKSQPNSKSGRNPSPKKSGRQKPVILIVDDEPKNVKLLVARLSNGPYQLEQAFSGAEALEKAKNLLPDLILLDVMMPEIDGYEVTRRLKSNSELKQIPIIMVTSLDSAEDKVKGMAAGAEEFLTKPVHTIELKARINSMIRLNQYREQLTSRQTSQRYFSEGSIESGEQKGGRARILLVEDTVKDLKLLKISLLGIDADIVEAASGEEAVDIVSKGPIDLILMDVILPGINGFEVCERIKAKDESKDIQIVLTTCLGDSESRIKGAELGCDDFLVKPVDSRELNARIKVLLKKSEDLKKLRSDYRNAMASAINDGLTGLYNRAYFMHFLELEIKRSQRRSHNLGLMMIDLDYFKSINDSLGHLAGDQLLIEVATVIKDGIREVDLAARYGGEEFAVIMPYVDEEGIAKAAWRLHQLISQFPYSIKNPSNHSNITASIGVALFPKHAGNPKALVAKADEMLYKAKESGRNKVCICQV